MSTLRDAAMKSKAWPFEEARALLKRTEHKAHDKGYVLFETGYGPSGLPHIGTFGEVARTTMIRRAFEVIGTPRCPLARAPTICKARSSCVACAFHPSCADPDALV